MSFEAVKCWLKLPFYPTLFQEGPYIDLNRNMVWESAKQMDDHLLFIDSDVVFTSEDVAKIQFHLNTGLDVVSGVYHYGEPPHSPLVFKRIEGDYAQTEVKEGLNEIDACGTGFMGINKNVIKNMPKDPFSYVKEGEITHGEDISFCHRLHERGFKLWMDSTIQIGHIRLMVVR